MPRRDNRFRDSSGRPSQAEVLREIDRIRARYGLEGTAPSRDALEDQARYIARRLGEEYSETHLELAPRLLTSEELEELLAELTDYERFLVQEIVVQEQGDDVA